MKNLIALREIKQEILQMEFNYQNIHRVMFLVYKCKSILEDSEPVPNKDIALDQTKKVISNEIMLLINSDSETEIIDSFEQVMDNFKLVLSYIA